MEHDTYNPWLLPIAILIGGALIAFAVYQVHHKAALVAHGDPSQMRPISAANDHILGNPAAPVVIVEYADIDSAYAKDFQATMNEIMKDNGSNGNVAWVFRNFPLVDQNQYAQEDAEGAECAAAQGNSNTFFTFINTLQSAVPGESIFSPTDFPALIQSLGLNESSFEKCMDGNTFQQKVADDYENALAVGATGSPYSILLVKGQKPQVISGYVPYAAMKQIVQKAISEVLTQ